MSRYISSSIHKFINESYKVTSHRKSQNTDIFFFDTNRHNFKVKISPYDGEFGYYSVGFGLDSDFLLGYDTTTIVNENPYAIVNTVVDIIINFIKDKPVKGFIFSFRGDKEKNRQRLSLYDRVIKNRLPNANIEYIEGIYYVTLNRLTEVANKINVEINTIHKNINENYSTTFNIEEFKQLKSFNQRILYCQKNLERISSGSSRIVYKIDDTKVLKLARNIIGLEQNQTEINFGNEIYLTDIVAKIFEYDERGWWLEMELATKLTEKKFKDITGFNFQDYIAAINNHAHRITNYTKGYKMVVDNEIVAKMWEDEFVYGIFQYIGNYQIALIDDLKKLNSYGIVKRNGEDKIVLIDYGLTDEIWNNHYKK